MALLVLVSLALAALQSAEELADSGRSHFEARRYAEALESFTVLLDEHADHSLVTTGSAHWYIAQIHRAEERYDDALAVLDAYRKSHPKGDGTRAVMSELFWVHDARGDEKGAKKAAQYLFKRYPEHSGTYPILLHYVLEGWKTPKLSTSYAVLYDWTFDRLDGKELPDARIAFIALLRRADSKASLFESGSALYCEAWAHMQAGRPEEAATIGEKYLKKFKKGTARDKTRLMLAESYLALADPDLDRARKHLDAILANPKSRYHQRASEMKARAETRGDPVQLEAGVPSADGLGRVVILTNLPASDAYRRALADWRAARDAEVVSFAKRDVASARAKLARIGAEFVAVVVHPEVVDVNFHLDMLELCRGLDADPMPDFHFGYLTARDSSDLAAFAKRILEKESGRGTRNSVVSLSGDGSQLDKVDFALHFGHGTPTEVVDGLSGRQINDLELRHGPVVFSGACFNGVLSRSYHRCAYQPVFLKPDTMDPAQLVALGWVHAGVTGFIGALEGDRGEMAMTEWEYFRTTAAPLGEVLGHQYRLAFTSLPVGYTFPRYRAGVRKRMGFYDVMLRGQVSRLLLSDPSFRALEDPVAEPVQESRATREADACVVEVHVLRTLQAAHLNYLPKSGSGRFDWRITARVALPDDVDAILGPAEPEISAGGKTISLTRSHVRHESWGGKRYVNVQVESEDSALVRPGVTVTFRFPLER